MRFSVSCFCWFLLFCSYCFGGAGNTPDQSPEFSSIRITVVALDSAKQRVLLDLAKAGLTNSEITEYRDFVAYLNSRIADCCRQLIAEGGSEAAAGLPCPSPAELSAPKFFLPPPSGVTSEEQGDKLDNDFMDALADFDDMLLKEDDKMASYVPSSRESGNDKTGSGRGGMSGADGRGISENRGIPETGQSVAEEGGAQQALDKTTAEQTETVGTQAEMAGGKGAGESPGNLPPPEDDDIVARQLREAAQKETDPELKKKLWKEYWKYKGRQGK